MEIRVRLRRLDVHAARTASALDFLRVVSEEVAVRVGPGSPSSHIA
jgi:hypothetical protein